MGLDSRVCAPGFRRGLELGFRLGSFRVGVSVRVRVRVRVRFGVRVRDRDRDRDRVRAKSTYPQLHRP